MDEPEFKIIDVFICKLRKKNLLLTSQPPEFTPTLLLESKKGTSWVPFLSHPSRAPYRPGRTLNNPVQEQSEPAHPCRACSALASDAWISVYSGFPATFCIWARSWIMS